MSMPSSASFDSDTDSSVDLDRLIGTAGDEVNPALTADVGHENDQQQHELTERPAGDNDEEDDSSSRLDASLQPRDGENPVAFGARVLVHSLTTSAFAEIRQIYDKHAKDIEAHMWPQEASDSVEKRSDIFSSDLGKFPFLIPASMVLDSNDGDDESDSDDDDNARKIAKDNKQLRQQQQQKQSCDTDDFSRAVTEYGMDEGEGEEVRATNKHMTWDKFEGGWTTMERVISQVIKMRRKMNNKSSGGGGEGSGDEVGQSSDVAPNDIVNSSNTTAINSDKNGSVLEDDDDDDDNDPHAALKLAPYGSRTCRYAFEDQLLDPVMTMPLRRLDIFFAIDELRGLDLKKDDASDVMGWEMIENDFAPPLFMWCASIIRWRLVHLGDKHAEPVDGLTCLVDFIHLATMYMLEERSLMAEISRRRKGGAVKESDWKLLKPLRDQYVHHREQCRKLLLLALTNITHFADGPLDVPSEVIWGLKAQRIHSLDDREPMLDLEETDLTDATTVPSSRRLQNIRRWKTPFHGMACLSELFTCMSEADSKEGKILDFSKTTKATILCTAGTTATSAYASALDALVSEEEQQYWTVFANHLVSSLPLITIPHPLQQFPVELRNPGLSADSGCTCDLCSCRNIRVTYEARKRVAHRDDNSTIEERAQFQFTSNLTRAGFDACATCAAAIASEAASALLISTGIMKPLVSSSSEEGGGHEQPTDDRVLYEDLYDANLSKIAEDEHAAEAQQRVSEPSSPLVDQRTCHALSIIANGSRHTFSVNNKIRVGRVALINWDEETDTSGSLRGLLSLFVAISPLGARPYARVWGENYSAHVVNTTLSAVQREAQTETQLSTNTLTPSPSSIAARRIIYAASLFKKFIQNAANNISVHQICNDKFGGGNVNDDECPICLELLNAASTRCAQPSSPTHSGVEIDFGYLGPDVGTTDKNDSSCDTADGSKQKADPARGVGEEENTPVALVTNTASQTSCGHWFHTHCLERFMLDNKCTTCPVCRTPEALESLAIKHMKAITATNVAEDARMAAKREEEIRKVRERRKKGSAQKKMRDCDSTGANARDKKNLRTEEPKRSDVQQSSPGGEGADTTTQNAKKNDAAGEAQAPEHITPEMVKAATEQTLAQNCYQLKIPFTIPKNSKQIEVLLGTIISISGGYEHPTDIGSSLKVTISLE